VVATGCTDFDPKAFDPSAELLPQLDGLTLLALAGIEDQPRPTAQAAIAKAKAAGIQVRMITGDHKVTAHAIARGWALTARRRPPTQGTHRRHDGRRRQRRANFTTQIFQAIGLGYGKPAPDLMQRKPRPRTTKILPAQELVCLAFVGLILGAGTLGVVTWGDHAYNTEVARTMGLTTFSLSNLLLALTVKDDLRSVFSLDTFDDRRLVLMSGLSVVAIVLATELNLFEKILETQSLNLQQWLICILVSSRSSWFPRSARRSPCTAARHRGRHGGPRCSDDSGTFAPPSPC
jgi:magnesium-transporting ATPase (P-type)